MTALHRGSVVVVGIIACSVILAASSAQARIFAGSVGECAERIVAAGQTVTIETFNPGVTGQMPAVIILHGADGMDEFGEQYREAGRQMAQAGYVAFVPHYLEGPAPEGSHSNPKLFLHWVKIVNATVRYAAAQENVDPCRIAIGGFSLGGFLAAAVGAENPRVRAVAVFFGGVPEPVAKNARRMPPTLIIHGCCDTRVPVSEAYRLAQVLARLGTPYQIHTYPGQGHVFDESAQKDAAKKVLAFLDCYL